MGNIHKPRESSSTAEGFKAAIGTADCRLCLTVQTLHLAFCPQVLTGGWGDFLLPSPSSPTLLLGNQSKPLAIGEL